MMAPEMIEPFRSQFEELIRNGAGARDVHDAAASVGYAGTEKTSVSDVFLSREVSRVETHQKALCPLIERVVGRCSSVLDVGCSTGGSTVALALSPVLAAEEVVGVDPNGESIDAARIRAKGYPAVTGRARFERITAGQALPFPDAKFDLCVTISVLEFITHPAGRVFFASELQRVTRPGGYVFLATPTPLRLREFHSRRWLGHQIRRDGFPWSSSRRSVNKMFSRCDRIPIQRADVEQMAHRRELPAGLLAALAPLFAPLLPWQKFLFRRNGM